MDLKDRLVNFAWRHPGPTGRLLRGALLPLSWAYGAGAWLHHAWRRRLPAFRKRVPVIIVGNLTVGGTGKTPLVAQLGRRLAAAGWTPGVVSRGYGGVRAADVALVSAGGALRLDAAAAGDEPWMLAHELLACGPVAVGADRVAAADLALREGGATALILDDGFQQRARFPAALCIVSVNAADAFGNGALLPAGSLREPPHALVHADIVVLTHADVKAATAVTDLAARVVALAPAAVVARAAYRLETLDALGAGERREPGWLAGRRVLALSGLGYPEGFEHTLRIAGAAHVEPWRAVDHYQWTPRDLDRAAARAREAGCEAVVTTAKDEARLPSPPAGLPWLVAHSGLVWLEGEEAFAARVLRHLADATP